MNLCLKFFTTAAVENLFDNPLPFKKVENVSLLIP